MSASPRLQPTSWRSTLRVHPERSAPEEAAAILSEGLVAHVGFVAEGQPFVIPMTYHYDPDEPRRLHLHGAHHSRLMAHLASGAPVCVTVTLMDGLVYSKTALYHSVNYRSAVCFARLAPELGFTPGLRLAPGLLTAGAAERSGNAETPSAADAQSKALLHAMIGRYFPGRTAGRDYEPAPPEHLDATAFVTLEIEEWSAKVRRGGPKGPRDADPMAPGTAGVAPAPSSLSMEPQSA